MLTRQENAFLKIAIIFLAVIVIIAGIVIRSFATQSSSEPKGGSFAGEEAVKEEKVGLLPVHVNGKYGFIDKTGKVVIPQFDEAFGFDDGLATVIWIGYGAARKEGYIDKTGRYIWKPTR